jgi:hypothetical protein
LQLIINVVVIQTNDYKKVAFNKTHENVIFKSLQNLLRAMLNNENNSYKLFFVLKMHPIFLLSSSFTLYSNNLKHDENENAKKLQNFINGLILNPY